MYGAVLPQPSFDYDENIKFSQNSRFPHGTTQALQIKFSLKESFGKVAKNIPGNRC
jgi:hypothetical protein